MLQSPIVRPDRRSIFTKQLVATLFVIFLTAGPALRARASPGQGCVLDRFVLPCAGVLYVTGDLRAPQPLLSTDIIFLIAHFHCFRTRTK